MIKKISQFLISISLIGLFYSYSCKENRIIELINLMKDKPISIFSGWDIWKRSDGIVFDLSEEQCRILIIVLNDELLYKQIFPYQDSVFLPLSAFKNSEIYNTTYLINFPDKVILFKNLNVDEVYSIKEDGLMKIVKDGVNIIYSKEGKDIRESAGYTRFTKFDNNWYYYTDKNN